MEQSGGDAGAHVDLGVGEIPRRTGGLVLDAEGAGVHHVLADVGVTRRAGVRSVGATVARVVAGEGVDEVRLAVPADEEVSALDRLSSVVLEAGVEQPAEGLCGFELRGGDAGAGVVEYDVGGIPALVGGVGRVGVDAGQVEVALGDGDAEHAECGDDRGRGRGCHYCPSAGVTGAAGSARVAGAASTAATGAAGTTGGSGVGATVTVLEPTPNAVVHGVT